MQYPEILNIAYIIKRVTINYMAEKHTHKKREKKKPKKQK